MASVAAINTIEKKGASKVTLDKGEFIAGFGLKGDSHGGDPQRQVSLLGRESMDKVTSLGIKGLCTRKFAENITTEGIELHALTVGTRFKAGEAVFEVTLIGKECHQICAIFHQTGECALPREVVFAKVIRDGIVKKGDSIIVIR